MLIAMLLTARSTRPTPLLAAGVLMLLAACGGGGGAPTALPPAGGSGGPAPQPATPTDVLTSKNDPARTGQNLTESVLTPANVASGNFGLLRRIPVDGKLDAQPLYVSQLNVAGATHDVAIVATEHASVYALDVGSGGVLWHVSLLAAGETSSDPRGCYQIEPEIGITATPVIDRRAGAHGAIYVVAMSHGPDGYHQRLHALDLSTGAELAAAAEIAPSFPAPGGASTVFDPGAHAERAALLLAGGTLYTSWTSHCDFAPYAGWVIAFDPATLHLTSALNLAAGSGAGPAIWMSGSGPAADAAGNVFLLTGNGAFDTTLDPAGFPANGNYGNAFVRTGIGGGGLRVSDYFALKNAVPESQADIDLGSGGILVLPDLSDAAATVHHLVLGAGKDGNLYVVDRDAMGRFDPARNAIWQELDGILAGGVFSGPAWFNGSVYYADAGGTLKALRMSGARLAAAPASQSATHFPYPGSSPVVSANGTANAIVWAHENGDPAVLHAYDAADLTRELYDSNQAGGRDQFGAGNKFITPTVADGRVLVGTQNALAVFGLR